MASPSCVHAYWDLSCSEGENVCFAFFFGNLCRKLMGKQITERDLAQYLVAVYTLSTLRPELFYDRVKEGGVFFAIMGSNLQVMATKADSHALCF